MAERCLGFVDEDHRTLDHPVRLRRGDRIADADRDLREMRTNVRFVGAWEGRGMIDIDRAKVEVAYQTRFWGCDCTCDPRFVEQALGDGNVLIGLQPLSARPNYYVIRVDSTWHLYGCRVCPGRCPDEITEHLEEIYSAIEEEYGEVESVRYNNENDLPEGEAPDSDDWPVLNLDCGSSWFTINPEKYTRNRGVAA